MRFLWVTIALSGARAVEYASFLHTAGLSDRDARFVQAHEAEIEACAERLFDATTARVSPALRQALRARQPSLELLDFAELEKMRDDALAHLRIDPADKTLAFRMRQCVQNGVGCGRLLFSQCGLDGEVALAPGTLADVLVRASVAFLIPRRAARALSLLGDGAASGGLLGGGGAPLLSMSNPFASAGGGASNPIASALGSGNPLGSLSGSLSNPLSGPLSNPLSGPLSNPLSGSLGSAASSPVGASNPLATASAQAAPLLSTLFNPTLLATSLQSVLNTFSAPAPSGALTGRRRLDAFGNMFGAYDTARYETKIAEQIPGLSPAERTQVKVLLNRVNNYATKFAMQLFSELPITYQMMILQDGQSPETFDKVVDFLLHTKLLQNVGRSLALSADEQRALSSAAVGDGDPLAAARVVLARNPIGMSADELALVHKILAPHPEVIGAMAVVVRWIASFA